MTAPPPRLLYAILELVLRCNLKCVHCAAGAGEPRPQELDQARWAEVIDDLASLGCPAVDLMGGEVMLSPLLLPVGRHLQRVGIPWGMLTNGWLLSAERAAALVDAGCRGVGVSLDGARVSQPGLLTGGCARCPHGATCRGGCPQMARAATGHRHDNPLCIRQAEVGPNL